MSQLSQLLEKIVEPIVKPLVKNLIVGQKIYVNTDQFKLVLVVESLEID